MQNQEDEDEQKLGGETLTKSEFLSLNFNIEFKNTNIFILIGVLQESR